MEKIPTMIGKKSTSVYFTQGITFRLLLLSSVCFIFNLERSSITNNNHDRNSLYSNNNGTQSSAISSNTATNNHHLHHPHHNHQGHHQPFGESGNKIPINTTSGFPNPHDFFLNNFIQPSASTPLLMKGAITASPAYHKWSDDYLARTSRSPENLGLLLEVETSKKERRNQSMLNMELHEFLLAYNETELYLVDAVPPYLESDLLTPCPIQYQYCIGHQFPLDRTMWLNSGGTKSVVHLDRYDNINCLYRGRKTVVLLDPSQIDIGSVIDSEVGVHSHMDVDEVDLNLYPSLRGATFVTADMEAGDCLFIPYSWIHQVRSYHSNLAVNYWFEHFHAIDVLLTTDPEHNRVRCPCQPDFTDNQLPDPTPTDTTTTQIDLKWAHELFILIFKQELHRSYLQQLTKTGKGSIKSENMTEAKMLAMNKFISKLKSNSDIAHLLLGDDERKSSKKTTSRIIGDIFDREIISLDVNEDGYVTSLEFDTKQAAVWEVVRQQSLDYRKG